VVWATAERQDVHTLLWPPLLAEHAWYALRVQRPHAVYECNCHRLSEIHRGTPR